MTSWGLQEAVPGSELFSLFHEEDISLAEAKMSVVDMLVSSSGMLLLHLLLHHNLCTESLLVECDGLLDLIVFQHQVGLHLIVRDSCHDDRASDQMLTFAVCKLLCS